MITQGRVARDSVLLTPDPECGASYNLFARRSISNSNQSCLTGCKAKEGSGKVGSPRQRHAPKVVQPLFRQSVVPMDMVAQSTTLEQAPRVPAMEVCDACPRVVDDLVRVACGWYVVGLRGRRLCTSPASRLRRVAKHPVLPVELRHRGCSGTLQTTEPVMHRSRRWSRTKRNGDLHINLL